MIHACFNFDDETEEIVQIPQEEDPRRKIHDVDFSELKPEKKGHVPLPIRRWIYHIDTTMRNKRGIGKMQAKWRKR